MSISSRTPEGQPIRCPNCGARNRLEFSQTGDATCPGCGQLVWIVDAVRAQLQDLIGGTIGIDDDVDSQQLEDELQADSLDIVELVMSLDDELGLTIPDTDYEQIRSIGDLFRYLEQRFRRPE